MDDLKAAGAENVPIFALSPRIFDPGFAITHASPSVRRYARERGVSLAGVSGSGNRDRVTMDDVADLLAAQGEHRHES